MTTKQVAEAVGKPEQTVRNWVRRLASKMDVVKSKLEASSPMKPADFDLDETIQIIAEGLGKNAAAVYAENARRAEAVQRAGNDDRFDRLAQMVESMAGMVLKLLSTVAPQAALPAAAPMTERDQLRRVMSKAGKTTGDFQGAWRELYTQYYYRYHRNLRECARNRGMDTIEYAESEGLVGELLALAVDIFGTADYPAIARTGI